MEGEDLVFKSSISGKPEPDILWLKDGKPITFSKRIVQSKESTTDYFLKIVSAQTVDAGEYTIKASNSAGEIEGSAKTLVKQTPSFDKNLEDKISITGQTCQFEVLASGIPDPSLKWFLNGLEIVPNDHAKLETKGHLHILRFDSVILKDDGEISVIATNDAGSATTKAIHTVHGKIIAFLANSTFCLQTLNASLCN